MVMQIRLDSRAGYAHKVVMERLSQAWWWKIQFDIFECVQQSELFGLIHDMLEKMAAAALKVVTLVGWIH